MDRLHRSKTNKVILGVCGGLAEYLRFDPTLVRILCILIAIPGPGLIIYLVAALIMPEDQGFTSSEDTWRGSSGANNSTYAGSGTGGTGTRSDSDTGSDFESEFKSDADDWERPAKYNSDKNKIVLGAILVGLGVLFLGKQIMPALFDLKYMIPLLLIGIGGIIVFKGRK
jgi:phage shock protein PspC (stress-responsive transcriptional regulator)